MILFCGEVVFLVATYKPKSCWQDLKYKLFSDETFPAASSESKVLFIWLCCFSFVTVVCIMLIYMGVVNCISYVMSFFMYRYRDREAPKLTESGFQFLVCIKWFIRHLNSTYCILITRSCLLWITADGYKCTTLVHH
jgi:hypothetical protein